MKTCLLSLRWLTHLNIGATMALLVWLTTLGQPTPQQPHTHRASMQELPR